MILSMAEILLVLLLLLQPLIFTMVTFKVTKKEITFIKTFLYFFAMGIILKISNNFILTYMNTLVSSQSSIISYMIQIIIIILLSTVYIMMLIRHKDNTYIGFQNAVKISVLAKVLFTIFTLGAGYLVRIFIQ